MITELERFQLPILAAAKQALEHADMDLDFIGFDDESFKLLPKTSTNYAVTGAHGAYTKSH